jgi:hypothetical protein
MFYDKRHSPEVQEWYYRLMNDPEKWRFKDTINDYNSIIAEFQKLNEQTPITQRYTRARILSGLKSKREVAKTQTEYAKFKKYKMRTTISK